MSNVTRLAMGCMPYMWSESSISGTNVSTTFYNSYLEHFNLLRPLLSKIGSDLDIVTELSEPNAKFTSLADVQTLWEGRADLSLEMYALRHDRFQLIDYLIPYRVSFTLNKKHQIDGKK